jgi:hypothetical protein
MKTHITHSSHNHVCTWQKLDKMRIPETGTQDSDNSRWCDWLGTCHMNVTVWFQCTIIHKQQHSSHLLQEWPPQATPHIPMYDECSNENWLLFEAGTPHQVYVLCVPWNIGSPHYGRYLQLSSRLPFMTCEMKGKRFSAPCVPEKRKKGSQQVL